MSDLTVKMPLSKAFSLNIARVFGGHMGKLNYFVINLQNPSAVYFAGQSLQGCVIADLREEMKVKDVKLEFRGSAKVHWTESESSGSGETSRTTTTSYDAKEIYFSFEKSLIRPGSGSIVLPPGHHQFPFTFTLPISLPSSFESKIGKVRYELTTILDRPWRLDLKIKKLFTVIGILDLNEQPSAAVALQGQNYKTLCCCCCESGPISAFFRIARTGYVPGEIIILNAEIYNRSSTRMRSSRVKLIMVTEYHSTSKTRTETQCVAMTSHGEIEPHGSDVWSSEGLIIPNIPPSFLGGCSIIDISYILQLEVEPARPAFDLKVPLQIIIGTIPLRQDVQQSPPSYQNSVF